ncbi:hypothetical protein DPMN_117713 [Dreissena polymorpha]|uniref:Uncharacterized protein n=1 Tax=Dreissena polymorpha TaxID=45954 RepID=A0A9D4JL04_DREPO|nr:hypothetical protein DPMN_117713 [Dreissena polymorpha]
MNYSAASFRPHLPLFLFRYEPTAKSSCSFKAGSRFVECVIRSLVTTKDHLLKELDRPGRDTSTEVNQIHWSYKQAKKNL